MENRSDYLLCVNYSYAFGHLTASSFHSSRFSIHPKPGKKSVRYNSSALVSSILLLLPLSFHADTHHRLGSSRSNECVPRKYSKKSGDTFKSSAWTKENNKYTINYMPRAIEQIKFINHISTDMISYRLSGPINSCDWFFNFGNTVFVWRCDIIYLQRW